MADIEFTRQNCISLLQKKYAELLSRGEERYPQRSDFSDREVMAIKAFLGPWPRALEAAGIKPQREGNAAEKSRARRIESKRRMNEKRKAERAAGGVSSDEK